MVDRVRNLPIGAHFILKRTGDRYELLGHKRNTPSGKRVWVKDCKVGDASRGVVFKDYKIKDAA